MEKYEITKDSILAAANKCSTAKDILKTMFPKAFEDDDNLAIMKDLDPIIFNEKIYDTLHYIGLVGSSIQLINARGIVNERGVQKRGFWLSNTYNWEFKVSVYNSPGSWLIPFKK